MRFQLRSINGIVLGECHVRVFQTLKETSDEGVFGDTLACRPVLGIEVPVHQELPETEESQRNLSSDAPMLLDFENFSKSIEIPLRRVFLLYERYFDAKVPSHFLYKREIAFDVF